MASPAEWAVEGHPGGAQHPDPGGVPRVPVVDIVRSLQFYLDEMGCVVREVADGWALLRSGPFAVLLIHEPPPTDPARLQLSSDPATAEVRPPGRSAGAPSPIPPPLIRLSTPDVRALRCRLSAHVLPARHVPEPVDDSGSVDKIEVYDPDRHRVVITQVGSFSRIAATIDTGEGGSRPPGPVRS